ncbi:hypothetical protein AAFF_G00098460 [Aldrovandia affinis]|uniref:UEV domain-containing protein n=1 Tax=Aldrovandia affinis TaxID=143900 RepID=A0AAD7WBE2_9TELE|nr:hypothetical protein AAFF_G00098460 [Aldrovandia affinis]
MLIKKGKHIDPNGKIYLPYLHEWKHPQSDLYGLIQVMIVVFGEEPPVFSCPTTQNLYLAVASPRFPKCRDAASPVVDTESSTKGQQDSVEPAVSDNDQTEMVPDECGSWPILYTPSAVSAPEQLSASLASLTVSPVSEESALLRQKMELEIAVLQKKKSFGDSRGILLH